MGFETDEAVIAHTFHTNNPAQTGASRCTACHMNPMQRFDQGDGRHSHDWVPREPLYSNLAAQGGTEPVPPNTCAGITGCHDDTVESAPLHDVDNLDMNLVLQSTFDAWYGKGLDEWPGGIQVGD